MDDGLPRFVDLPAPAAPVTVVGDVHLSARRPRVERRFLAWLDERAGRGGTLVLLGDVFDWWVGRGQERDPALEPVLAALRRTAAAGVTLCFQPGNRDFAFQGAAGIPLTVWPDVVRTQVGGRTVLFTHGDLLVSGDRSYLALRRVLRSRTVAWGLRRLPYRWLAGAARALRRVSVRAVRRKDRRTLDIDYGLARRWLEGAQAEVLVAGHVHTGVHHRLPGTPRREVLVLKDWDDVGSAVVFDGGHAALRAVGGI